MQVAAVQVSAGAPPAAVAERAPGRVGAAASRRSVVSGRAFAVLRRSFPVDAGSRQRTEELLGGLRSGGWRLGAWYRFCCRASVMSWQAAVARPRAAAEVTALHAVLFWLARDSGRGNRARVAASWLLAVTHLGLLGQRRSLGAANAVTLARANLPALACGPWTGLAAMAADLLDGQLARRANEVTVFGSYADTLADAAFWTWFAARHEPSRVLRTAAFAAWTAPVAAATALSVTRGRMTGILRHELLRPAAPLEVLLLARACARHATHKKLAFCTPPDTSPRRRGRRRLLRH